MTEQRARYLLASYLQQGLSQEEQQELFNWINDSTEREKIDKILRDLWEDFMPVDSIGDEKAQLMLSQILAHKTPDPVPGNYSIIRMNWLKWVAAAVIVFSVGLLGYQHFSTPVPMTPLAQKDVDTTKGIHIADALPGTIGATLTLGDGSFIVLDTITQKAVALQGNTKILKQNGRVIYENDASLVSPSMYNTLNTDRGHQYSLTLSDGTSVLLNAASSIRFPVMFTGKQRSVEITGEAYFEVAKNGKPFIVHTAGAAIEVLGTHFNVNSYEDEAGVNTTLLEGLVKITHGTAALLLAPGQGAQVAKDGALILNRNADTEAAISWTQGYFHFNEASLETVLRQLARWYNVDVVYEKHYPDENYGGDIQKSLHLSQVLKILDKSNVHLRIQGKQLIVMK